ncbi:MAG: PD40 domain-containing protein [Candidatus Methanomethylophilaceae archaeon]|nr:PD40 domain-containing protein [Candidatus Methanomethylophilaceae archaeon]
MERPRDYYAFISYQRRDEKWAGWIRKRLEHYRLPSNLRKKDASLPKEIRPVFQDALELSGGILGKEIQDALGRSKFLVVICTPNAAKSPWVDKEIQTFIDSNREDQVIPFIVDGVPFSGDPETECFPPSLHALRGDEKEILGININEMGRDAAAVKVVARMFGLKFDVLWQRFERERKRRRAAIVGGVLLFALASLGVGAYIVRQNQELAAVNREVTAERDRANAERDRAEEANSNLLQANDSIRRQYRLIEDQKNEIARERDNVKRASHAMQINLSRALGEKASALVDEGDAYLASILALNALPPRLPYTEEAEAALRKATASSSTVLQRSSSVATSLCFTHDGKRILSSLGFGAPESLSLQVIDVMTGKVLRTLAGGGTAAFDPHDERIVATSGNAVIVLDSQTGEILHILTGHSHPINSVAFSPDGKRIVSASDDWTVKIWDSRTGSLLHSWEGHQKVVESVSFSPDGRYVASASNDGAIMLWDVKTGERVRAFTGHTSGVTDVAFSPDGKRIVSGSYDESARVWDVNTGALLFTLKDGYEQIHSCSFSPDGKSIVTGESSGVVTFWDAHDGKRLRALTRHTESVNAVTFSPDGKLLASSSDDGTVVLWEMEKKGMTVLYGHTSPLLSAAFSPDGTKVATGAVDKTVRVWDARKGAEIRTLEGHGGFVVYVAFSPDGKELVSASQDRTVRVWDVETGREVQVIREDYFLRFYETAVFSHDGKHILVAASDAIMVYDRATGEMIRQMERYSNMYESAIFSPDDRMVVSTTLDGGILIFDAETGLFLKSLHGHDDAVFYASFSPDGKRVVSASIDNTIRIWDVNTGSLIRTLEGHSAAVAFASFSKDGKKIVSASDDHTVKVWDADSGALLQTFEGHSDRVKSAMFSPDGERIVSSSYDDTAIVWEFPDLQRLIEGTQDRFKTRPLTEEERRKYYLE